MSEIISGLLSIVETEFSKLTRLDKIVTQALSTLSLSSEIMDALSNKTNKDALLNLMLHGHYMLTSVDTKTANYYAQLFKDNFNVLSQSMGEANIRHLVSVLSTTQNCLRIVPMAYQEIVSHDKLLEPFKTAEIFGHFVPYQVAKNPSQIKKEFILNKQGDEPVERYEIKEIKVMHSKVGLLGRERNEGLMGSILIPDNLATAETPTLYICWKGTDSQATIELDLEVYPGSESYRRSERQILEQISSAIKTCTDKLPQGKKLNIVVAGHSLGGALSQLCYNSLQRVLARELAAQEAGSGDKTLDEHIKSLENSFVEEESALSAKHQQKISDIHLDPNAIAGLTLTVANSAGISKPVQDFSNTLASILKEQGIEQSAHYLKGSGDPVGVSGQGILSNVPDNPANVSVLHVNYQTPGIITTALGNLGAPATALVLFGTGTVGAAAATVTTAVTLVKTALDKKVAHTDWHFEAGDRPFENYTLSCSHDTNGDSNEAGCKDIREQLSNQSMLVSWGSRFISYMREGSSVLREDSKKASEAERFVDEYNAIMKNDTIVDKHPVLELLLKELKAKDDGCEERIFSFLTTHSSIDFLNMKNAAGDSILMAAIQNEQYEFAGRLLTFAHKKNEHYGIDLNTPNVHAETPLLICLKKITEASSVRDMTQARELALRLKQVAEASSPTMILSVPVLATKRFEQYLLEGIHSSDAMKKVKALGEAGRMVTENELSTAEARTVLEQVKKAWMDENWSIWGTPVLPEGLVSIEEHIEKIQQKQNRAPVP
jgi:hypothetical protein